MKLRIKPQFSHRVWLHCSGSQGAIFKCKWPAIVT